MMTFMDRCINHGLAGKAADLSIITFILDLVSISIRGVLAVPTHCTVGSPAHVPTAATAWAAAQFVPGAQTGRTCDPVHSGAE